MPISNNILAGSGQSSSDLGDTIEQSLRFNGTNSVLSRAIATDSAGTISTFSVWIKIGEDQDSTNQPIFSYGGSAYFMISNTQTLRVYGGAAVNCDWTGKTRDYSGWYHVVIQGDGNGNSTNNKCWINGREISTEFNSRDFPGITQNGGTFRIGCDSGSANFFEGYLADFICVNGSAVDPLDNFGKYNKDGVWVPVDYTGSYGAKGFRLKFDSSVGIGKDSSGNNNDFTASGFDEYSNDVKVFFPVTGTASTAALGTTLRGVTPDGNGTGGTIVVNSTNHMDVDFGRLATSHTLTITNSGGGVTIFVSPDGTANSWIASNVTNASFTSGQTITASNNSAFRYLRFTCGTYSVGNVLAPVGSADNADIDLFDTPTSNYATFNPLFARFKALDNAHLSTGTSGSWQNVGATIVVPETGQYYFEYYAANVSTENRVGFQDAHKSQADGGSGSVSGYWFVSSDGTTQTNGSSDTAVTAWSAGDILGVRFDMDNDEVKVFRNNNLIKTWDISSVTTRITAFVSSPGANNSINFGQKPFQHSPPSGYKALQTNDLLEPTIKNGEDHAITVLDTGANIRATAEATFTDRVIFIKARGSDGNDVQDAQWQVLDTVRGGNDALTFPMNSSGTNQAFVNTYDAPETNALAYCFNAGSPGTNGFEIIEDTSPSAGNNVISHNLGKPPEFILSKEINAGNTDHINVYHTSLGTTGGLLFSNAAVEHSNAFRVQAVSNTTFTMGDSETTKPQIHYVWTSIEGFSKFGSYNNNGATTFIYTGFKPAILWIKKTGVGESWYCSDNKRNPNNPVKIHSAFQSQAAEFTSNGDRDIDFLSNGFKIRGTDSQIHGSAEYVYMAWAEHPFGGENQPPVTAR